MKRQRRHQWGLLMITCMVILWATRPCIALVISEVMYHPADEDETLEFIELYNNRAVFEDLSGYAFTNGIDYTFESGAVIGPKDYLVLARDPAALEAAYGINGVYGPFTGRLDNGGERIKLSNDKGEIVISFRYDDDMPWPVSPDGSGHSLILSKLGGDPEEASTWSASMYIGGTPGQPDEVQVEPEDPTLVTLVDVGHAGWYFKGTREPSPNQNQQATIAWTQPQFNDNPNTTSWSEGPSGYGYSNDAAELQFIRTELNDMNGNYMSIYARLRFTLTQEQINSFTQLRAGVHYDDGFVLYLNGTRVADSGEISGNPPAYNQSGGQATDPPVASIDLTSQMDLLIVGTNVLAIQVHNASLSGSSDCIACPILQAVVEQAEGGYDTRACVVINELLANSDAPPGTDWIELYNPGSVAVDLSNVYLSDDRDDLLQYKIPDGTVLQPGEFWAVREGSPPSGTPFALDFAGETVYVTAATNDPEPELIRVLDAVRYETMEPDVTFGRFPDGSKYFGFLDAATFERPNAQPVVGDIIINEIMYHHGTRDERYEYVELYNRSSRTVSLSGWAFTDGIEYEFDDDVQIRPGSYLVVANDPELLSGIYGNLVVGSNLVGPYSGGLNDHSERIRLSLPLRQRDPQTGRYETYMVTADEVTYYDGGRWPIWADGKGTSLELRDPRSNNDTPYAWADSDESSKTTWEQFAFTISGSDPDYTHDQVRIFDIILLNQGEILLDDLELIINGSNRLSNNGFENGESGWRILGNHVRSFVTTDDSHSGSRSLHVIATGHGDPGANRINRSISSINAGTVTFRGWARWLRGSRYLLLRTTRERAPVQPPRPAHAFELTMPLDIGTPGYRNTAFVSNRGPDILEVQHAPVLPASGEPIVVTAHVIDNDNVGSVTLYYRSEGSTGFSSTAMLDNASGDDLIAGDGIYTATIPGASGGTMRAFYIEASDGSASTRFPTKLEPTADVPDRTCLVYVGDSLINSEIATYRIWLSNDVINTFRSRPNLSNELLDCTFVYNDTEVFYNCGTRYRGSPFIRSGEGRDPRNRYAYRIDFNPDQKFRDREEINLDSTEGGNRGPLQERASYWFYRKMGLQYSMQEFIWRIVNGRIEGNYEEVQKVDGSYIEKWFPDDANGYIHKIDDYFEYSSDGAGYTNLDEGLKHDSRHPLLKETYRWGFEKRSHREDDNWDHLFDLAVALNTSSGDPDYEEIIESVIDPEHFARILAIRHAVGDWDSYGYDRGKNNYFYYAPNEDKWYLLPWDIDFTLGSGDGYSTNLFAMNSGQFPEVYQFLNYPKYRQMYLQAFADLVNGPWKTSYGTGNPPTEFDQFLDDSADVLIAEGLGDGRRDGIKQFVRSRRSYIMTQVNALRLAFEITTNHGEDFCTSDSIVTIKGTAPQDVAAISMNGKSIATEISSDRVFEVDIRIVPGPNVLNFEGIDIIGNPVPGATDSITVTYVSSCAITSVTPDTAYNDSAAQLTIHGSGFEPGSTSVTLTRASQEIGFDALYVQSNQAFDQIDAATLLLDDPTGGVGDATHAVHRWLNLSNPSGLGEFGINENELDFAPPFDVDGENFAVRFTGYILAPSPGTRYFGVNSDDGFSLWIDDQLVGQFAGARAAATTDVTKNRTAGTMTFDFPAAGRYFMVLDFYENGGEEAIEFFQTDSTGGNPRLINVDSELFVFRDDVMKINATDVVVVDENTITCQVDLNGAVPDTWNVVVTPQNCEASQCELDEALQIIGAVTR